MCGGGGGSSLAAILTNPSTDHFQRSDPRWGWFGSGAETRCRLSIALEEADVRMICNYMHTPCTQCKETNAFVIDSSYCPCIPTS